LWARVTGGTPPQVGGPPISASNAAASHSESTTLSATLNIKTSPGTCSAGSQPSPSTKKVRLAATSRTARVMKLTR
jgi:hypothetical protein